MKSTFVLMSVMLISIGLRNFSPENVSLKQNPKGFAVIELFTSEGCSSCPSADEAVTEIAKENAETVFVIGFHVDYWNNLGWKDQFSDHGYSERQKQYASIFNLNSIYTPQVIVNGKKEFVGSDRGQLKKTIAGEIKSTRNLFFDINAESYRQQNDYSELQNKGKFCRNFEYCVDSAIRRNKRDGWGKQWERIKTY